MSYTQSTESGGEPAIEADVEQLLHMMRYRRKHGSQTEVDFINDYLINLTGIYSLHAPAAKAGEPGGPAMCYVLDVGTPTIVFSSHVDTVHSGGGMQVVEYDANLRVAYKQDNQPLGADDAAGVWLLLQMIDAGVPGRYMFHRGEECGGLGSKMVAEHHRSLFAGIDHAVAFDRKGDCSVITYQRGGRCCSDKFADELACRLTALTGHTIAADETGSFTDTANYTGLVGECTNVSVGYLDEHSGKEMLDIEYLLKLREACCIAATWSDLPVVRKAGEHEPRTYGGWYSADWGFENYRSKDMQQRRLSLVDRELEGILTYDEVRRAGFADLKEWAMREKASDVAETVLALADMVGEYADALENATPEDEFEAWLSYTARLEDLLEVNGIRFDHLDPQGGV
jgi:hypothetical protein